MGAENRLFGFEMGDVNGHMYVFEMGSVGQKWVGNVENESVILKNGSFVLEMSRSSWKWIGHV